MPSSQTKLRASTFPLTLMLINTLTLGLARHSPSSGENAEYERLRGLAHTAQNKSFRDYYNCQARDYIFHVNNNDRAEDEIDLHGLFVQEATTILRKRFKAEIKKGRRGIHV